MAKSKTAAKSKSKSAAKSKPASKPAPTATLKSQENLDQSGREFYNDEELKQQEAADAENDLAQNPDSPEAQASIPVAAKRSRSKPKAVPTPVVEQNGIKQPGEDTFCRKVWDVLDDLRTAGVDATAKNARDALKDAGMADATVRTQYARWRKYHGTADAS